MTEEAYIMVEQGFLKANATKKEPILIDAQNKDKKWKGIYVNSSNQENKNSNKLMF